MGGVHWLIRQSKIKGMLSVDFYGKNLSLDEQEKFGPCDDYGITKDSARFALIDTGWVGVEGSEVKVFKKKMKESVTRLNADKFVDSLFELLEKVGFHKCNRLTPQGEKMSKRYCGYVDLSERKEKKRKTEEKMKPASHIFMSTGFEDEAPKSEASSSPVTSDDENETSATVYGCGSNR